MRKNDRLFVEMSRSQGFPQKMVRKKKYEVSVKQVMFLFINRVGYTVCYMVLTAVLFQNHIDHLQVGVFLKAWRFC